MKTYIQKILFAFTIVLAVENSYAQDPVFPSVAVNPAGPLFDVRSVSYLNKDTAVAVGSNGMAWKSVDGGMNWTTLSTFTSTANNNAVYMEDDYICIAGDLGTVSFSSDNGQTWQNTSQAQNNLNYHDVDFADTTFGVSVGDNGDAVVYKWTGSFGWSHIASGLASKLNSVAAFKTNPSPFADGNAIAVGDQGSVVTYAACAWTILTNTIAIDLNGVYLFPDHTTVLAVGDSGLIMRSADLGNTWNILNFGTKEALNDISEGVTADQFIAVGDSGVIYVSSDTGNTFTRYTVGFNTTNLKGVSAKNPRGSFGGSGNTLRTFSSTNNSSSLNSLDPRAFKVSPNPANSIFTVLAPDGLLNRTMHLFNSFGTKVYSKSIRPGLNQCDISVLEPGVYYVVIDAYKTKIVITE